MVDELVYPALDGAADDELTYATPDGAVDDVELVYIAPDS